MKTIVDRVAKNTGIIILGNIIINLIGIITVVYLARYLGANNFGVYSFIFAYLGFFNIIIDLGTSSILVRDMAQSKINVDKFIGNAIIMRVILSFLAILLSCLIIFFLKHSINTKLLVCVASLSFLLSFSRLYVLVFQANLRMKYPTMVSVLDGIMKLALFLWLIFIKASLFWFIVGGVVINLPGLFIIIFLSKRFVKPTFEIDFGLWRNLLRESWPIALTTTLIMIYTRVDQLMLFQMRGAEAVGHYAAVVRLTEIFNIIPIAFMASVFPLLSKYFVDSADKFKKTYELSFKYMSILIMPIVMGIFILSEPIIKIVYGEQFIKSIPALRILMWSEIFVFLGAVHVRVLISTGLQRLDFIFTFSSAAVNVILNLLLIPHYGIIGASIATCVSYFLGVPLTCALAKTRKYGIALVYSTLKPLIAAGIMGCFTYFIFILHFPLAIIIFSSAIVYFGIIVLIKGIDRQDQKYFKRIIAHL